MLRMHLGRQLTIIAGFRSAAINHAAQNFTMPAMSPTMTEGNITSWKVKEGAFLQRASQRSLKLNRSRRLIFRRRRSLGD